MEKAYMNYRTSHERTAASWESQKEKREWGRKLI